MAKNYFQYRMEFLHPAMWQVALVWHATEFAETSAILEFYIWFRFRPHHRRRRVILHQSSKFYPNRTTSAEKNDVISIFKMAEIHHLGNRHDVIFSAVGGPIWIKFRRLVQNDMLTVVMWSKSKPDVEFQYGGHLKMSSQSHASHCRVLPLGEFTVTIPEPHATLQGAVIWRN